jgi:hypothetical protein
MQIKKRVNIFKWHLYLVESRCAKNVEDEGELVVVVSSGEEGAS